MPLHFAYGRTYTRSGTELSYEGKRFETSWILDVAEFRHTGDLVVMTHNYFYLVSQDLEEILCQERAQGWFVSRDISVVAEDDEILDIHTLNVGFPGVSMDSHGDVVDYEVIDETVGILCEILPPEMAVMIVQEVMDSTPLRVRV